MLAIITDEIALEVKFYRYGCLLHVIEFLNCVTVLNWKSLAVLMFLKCQVNGFFVNCCEMTVSHSGLSLPVFRSFFAVIFTFVSYELEQLNCLFFYSLY